MGFMGGGDHSLSFRHKVETEAQEKTLVRVFARRGGGAQN